MIRARNRILRSTFCLLLAIIAVAAVVLQYTPEGAFAASGTTAAASPTFKVIDGADSGNNSQNYYALFDNSLDTKYCITMDKGPYVVFKSSMYQTKIVSYTLYTGNDTASHSGRNPKDWKLLGSNNYDESTKTGTWWYVQSISGDETLGAENKTGYTFTVNSSSPYLFYKFEFTARRGAEEGEQQTGSSGNVWYDTNIQLSEIEINATCIADEQTTAVTLQTYDPEPWFIPLDGTASTSGTEGETYDKAFDATNKKYCTDIAGDPWIILKAPSYNTRITGYTFDLASHIEDLVLAPRDWELYGCNDYNEATKSGGSWTSIQKKEFVDIGTGSYTETLAEPASPYKYYKFQFRARQDPQAVSGLFELYEVKIQADVDMSQGLLTGSYWSINEQSTWRDGDKATCGIADQPIQVSLSGRAASQQAVVYGAVVHFAEALTEPNYRTFVNGFRMTGKAQGGTEMPLHNNVYTSVSSDKKTYTFITDNTGLYNDTYSISFQDGNGTVLTSGSDYKVAEIELLYRFECEHDFIKPSFSREGKNFINATVSTCTNQGARAYRTCVNGCGACQYYDDNDNLQVCEANQFYTKVLRPLKAHSISTWYSQLEQAPTCSADGYYKNGLCSSCNKIVYEVDGKTYTCASAQREAVVSIPATGAHTVKSGTLRNASAAECIYSGNYKYYECLSCGKYVYEKDGKTLTGVYADTQIAPTGEHTFSTTEIIAEVPATCSSTGTRAHWYCTTCKKNYGTDKSTRLDDLTIAINPAAHTYGDWTNAVAPSCTQAGYCKHRQCTGCSAYEYVDAGGEAKACASAEYESKIKLAACHTFGAWVPYKPNTCTEDGNHWYRKCSKCDVYEWFTLIASNTDPDAYLAEHPDKRKTTTDFSDITWGLTAGHTWSTTQLAAAKEPSCTEDGNYEWKKCNRCNGYQYTIGESTYFCAENEFDTKVKLPKHHTWGSVVQGTAPTCEEAGSVAYRQCTATGCGKCQYSSGKHTVEADYFDTTTDRLYIENSVSELPTISKLGHSTVLVNNAAAPTCTEYGNYTYYRCDQCNQYRYYLDGTEYFCSATEEAYNTYIRRDKIEHSYGTLIVEAPASCTETGMAAHYECSECHGLFDASKAQKTEQELTLAINPSNHVYATSCSKRCSKCTQERPEGERVHKFDKDGSAALVNGNTEQHTYFCTNDNCPDGTLNEDHTMVLAYAQDGSYKHWYKCSKQGCPYETSKTNCVIKHESKDATYHVSYCEIDGTRHELGTNGAQNTENHSWTLTFKQDKYDAGEGTYHDSYCAVCNTWKGEETACNLSYNSSDSTDHWRNCSACKKSGLDKQAHSFVMVYDGVDHWEECTVCEGMNGDYIKHIFESEISAGCSETRCGYQRFLSADISVSGYTIDALISGLTFSGTTNRADTRLTLVKRILLDSDAKELDLARGFKFRPNSTYYAILDFNCGNVYPSLDMTAGDFSLPDGFELGHYYIDIDDSTNNVILSMLVTLPALGGVSAEKSVSEMEIDIKGFAEGKTLGDVTIGITCKGLPTDKSFTVKHKSYSSIKGTETDKTVIGNTSYSIRMDLEAPDGFSFYGLTDSDITVKNNMGTAYMAPMSEESKISSDGKSITVTVVINSLVPEHVCGEDGWDIIATLYDFLCPDRTKQHTRMCKTCAAIEFVNHVYDDDTDTECDECHYTRTLRLDEMKITLTGYESDKALVGISASYNGKYSGVISISAEYAPRIVDLDTGYTYSKKATFVPGKTYGLMLELNIPSSIDISNCTLDNVYVNGTKVKVVLGVQDDTAAMYVLELPAVKGESEQTKVSDVTLEVSGFVPGSRLNDVSNNYNAHPGIDGVGIIVTENGNAMSGTDVFAYGKQYVLKVTYFLKNGYYGTGVTAADLKVSHYAVSGSQKTDLGSFECIGITVDDFGDPDTDKRTITCEYLVVLDIPAVGEEEHSHSFPTENPQYHTDEGKHYVLCGCGARAEGQAHVYEEDDLFTCTVCGYERVYSAERLELEISDWHVGNYSNSILRSSGFYIDGNEVLFDEDGYSDWPLNIMAAILCEGKITDLSLEQLKKAEVVLAGKNYSLVIMLTVDPYYLSLGALTEKDYIIKGIGKTDITASVVLNIFSFGYPLVALFFDIPATEAKHIHGGTWIDGAPADCYKAGTKGYYVCTVCGDKFDAENVKIDDLTIEALGHNQDGSVTHVDARCTEAGVVGGTYCTRCNDGKAAAEAPIGALGHSLGTWIDESPATLEKDGAVAHKDCERCGKHFDANGNEIADKDYTIAKIPGYNLIFTVDGKQAARYYLAQGSAVTYPTENTSKEGFTFAWSQTIETMPNKDVTIEGIFSVDVNYFKGKVNAVQSASTVEDIYSAAAEATAALALYKDADTQAISDDIAQLEALVNQYKQTAQNAASDIADTLKVVSAVFAAPVQTTVVAFTADIDKRRLL